MSHVGIQLATAKGILVLVDGVEDSGSHRLCVPGDIACGQETGILSTAQLQVFLVYETRTVDVTSDPRIVFKHSSNNFPIGPSTSNCS